MLLMYDRLTSVCRSFVIFAVAAGGAASSGATTGARERCNQNERMFFCRCFWSLTPGVFRVVFRFVSIVPSRSYGATNGFELSDDANYVDDDDTDDDDGSVFLVLFQICEQFKHSRLLLDTQ